MYKLLRYLRPYSWNMFLILLFLFGQSIAELYLPTLMSDVVDKGMMQGKTGLIWKYGSYMLIVAMGSGLSALIGSFLSAITSTAIARDIRNALFTRVESYSLNEFDIFGTASLITRNTNDITQVQMLLMMGMRFMIYAPVMCIGGIVMAISKEKALTWIIAVFLPLTIILIGLLTMWIVPMFNVIQVRLDKVNRVFRENLTGMRVIRAFDRTQSENRRFRDANQDLTSLSIKVNRIMGVTQPFMMFTMNAASIVVIWFGGVRISQNFMEIGDMMAFLQYATQIMSSVLMVTMMFVMVPRAQASAVRISQALELEPDICDTDEPVPVGDKKGYIEFRDVTFSYSGAAEPAISNMSFSLSPGEFTAIIGGTGSGKSTLINLIPRFYDPDSGSVLVDGVDTRDMTQEVLREKIGLVPQSPILFTGTIAENIRYGKKNATDEEVAHAADIAQSTEFIDSMSDGFNSAVVQGGANFSGGQKQRLSIARALVRKPEIYIFDDSFSALDFKTDARLRSALRKETGESTVILIAQRASTVMDADRIIVLDRSRIVGMGKHKELMDTCNVYREIVSSQLSEEELS